MPFLLAAAWVCGLLGLFTAVLAALLSFAPTHRTARELQQELWYVTGLLLIGAAAFGYLGGRL